MQPDNTDEQVTETPLERAARQEAERQAEEATGAAQGRRDEHEADVLVNDIDQYVARTDPASLPEAEAELNAWQIPTDPREGIPADTSPATEEDDPLVVVFAARTEPEANIVLGLLEAEGVPVMLRDIGMPVYGSIFSLPEERSTDVLVPTSLADRAREIITASTTSPAPETSGTSKTE